MLIFRSQRLARCPRGRGGQDGPASGPRAGRKPMVRRLSLALCAVLLISLAATPPVNATPLSLAGIWTEAVSSMERWLGLGATRGPDSGSVRWISAAGGCDIDPAGHCKDQ